MVYGQHLKKIDDDTGRTLRALNVYLGVSRVQLSRQYGLPISTIADCCNGRRKLPPDTAETMRRLLAWHNAGNGKLAAVRPPTPQPDAVAVLREARSAIDRALHMLQG